MLGVKMRFLSVLAITTDFNSGCSGHKKANLRRADVSYFLPLLLAEKEIGDVYRKATWSLSNAKIVLYFVVLIQLSDDYHPQPLFTQECPWNIFGTLRSMEKEKLLFEWVEVTTGKTSACVLRLYPQLPSEKTMTNEQKLQTWNQLFIRRSILTFNIHSPGKPRAFADRWLWPSLRGRR